MAEPDPSWEHLSPIILLLGNYLSFKTQPNSEKTQNTSFSNTLLHFSIIYSPEAIYIHFLFIMSYSCGCYNTECLHFVFLFKGAWVLVWQQCIYWLISFTLVRLMLGFAKKYLKQPLSMARAAPFLRFMAFLGSQLNAQNVWQGLPSSFSKVRYLPKPSTLWNRQAAHRRLVALTLLSQF